MKKLMIPLALLSGFVAIAQKQAKADSVKIQQIQEVTMTKKSV